ncbi:MAG: hypothetical protein R3C46_06180 [Hyphomonadaceae bacterium]
MIPLLSVGANEIAALSDADLRDLVALLCRFEARTAGFSATCVRAGGNQDAPDGGLDVVVETPAPLPQGGYLARSLGGLQVKKPALGEAGIANEMRPNGVLRPSIVELIAAGGAYLIISSGASVTKSARDDRRAAMRSAVSAEDPQGRLHLDFLGRDEIAAWANAHAGAVMWIKSRLGAAPSGWKSYGRWSRAPVSGEPFFADADTTLIVEGGGGDRQLPLIEGVEVVRQRLRQRGRVARLVGLSGTGKTRFAEALFDPGVGADALCEDDVIYADIGADPQPSPLALIEQLKAAVSEVVVVIDNCPPNLHNSLAQAVHAHGSRLRLLTIEYDVRADQPEETDVFRLVGLSDAVLERLLRSRHAHLSDVDRRRLAEISDGNARVALALADAIGRDVDASALTNDDLINRLFHQRHVPDAALLAAAQTVSMVYSFDGETITVDSELAALAQLGNNTSADLFARVADLGDRDLIQSRSKWRAFLPHPLANHLAKKKIDRTPDDALLAFAGSAPARLVTSFCRRLGYLHDHLRAATLSARLIGEMREDDTMSRERLGYLAPSAPEAALGRIQVILRKADGEHFGFNGNLTGLIHGLAYEPVWFERCVQTLVAWKRATKTSGGWRDGDIFQGLFWLHLSGTRAPVTLRIEVAERLASSDDPDDQAAALNALHELLHSGQFSSGREFSFGMRRRDFGWQPTTYGDTAAWYAAAIAFACRLIARGDDIGRRAQDMLATELPSLLAVPFVAEHALAAARTLFSKGYWPAGWRALRVAAKSDEEELGEDVRAEVLALLSERAPATLEDRLDVVAGADEWSYLDVADDDDEEGDGASQSAAPNGSDAVRRYHRANAAAVALGEELAADPATLERVLPRLAAGRFGRANQVGTGLMQGASSPSAMWRQLAQAFKDVPRDKADDSMLCGAVRALSARSRGDVDAVLDAVAADPALAQLLPTLQRYAGLDSRGVDRLVAALAGAITPVQRFRALIGISTDDGLRPNRIADLTVALGSAQGGHDIAIEIVEIALRFEKADPSPELLQAGAELLAANPFSAKPNNVAANRFADLARRVLKADAYVDLAYDLMARLVRARMERRAYGHEWRKYAQAIVKARPCRALDALLLDGELGKALEDLVREGFDHREDLLQGIDLPAIIAWAEADPSKRFAVLAKFAPLMALPANDHGDNDELSQLHPVMIALIDRAPDKAPVLAAIQRNFYPRGVFSGPLSSIFRRRRDGVAALASHAHPDVRAWAASAVRQLEANIADAAAREERVDRREQRFE